MEKQLHERTLYRHVEGLAAQGLMLKDRTLVHVTLVADPSSTKNNSRKGGTEMHQMKKGNQWLPRIKAHLGMDAESGRMHVVIGTAANVNDVTQAAGLLHGDKADQLSDAAGYEGVAERDETKDLGVTWHVAMRPGKCKALVKNRASQKLIDELEKLKASIIAKAEHPIRVIKQHFGFAEVHFKVLAKYMSRIQMLFAMNNFWKSRKLNLQGTQAPLLR
jgi:IS5 family transposase